ncbi:Do family serine endopeptidase [Luminiphilus sp. nBUS_07]|uniref:Do family serine endopeptidase n=1 Tax=Luminiphilus sp. nBUS_07 TaxID=3395314 RepID=UPI003EB94846
MYKFVIVALLTLLPWSTRAALPDFQPIVESAAPAVVKILVEANAQAQPMPGADELEELPEYLRRFFEFRGQAPQQRQRQNTGSGFIISEDGYIVTNHHVVEGATSVTVRLLDRREFEAEIVGTDVRSDLALLKIESDDLSVLKIAEDDVAVGEWVLAIGSPFGLDFSVTAGIVSAKGRSLPTEAGENYVPFIQTDVAINPGNSGGPLFDLQGEVVGVNSQIFTRSGGSIGLSFAIPAAVVNNVVMQLKASGEVTRGWLGVSIQDVDLDLAESFGLDRPSGALIAQVGADSPAQEAGLQSGDIILEFDGQMINTSSDLPHVVGLIAPGSEVEAVVRRDGQNQTLQVVVGGLDADERPSVAGRMPGADDNDAIFGMVLEAADDDMMAELGLSGGVLVLEVAPDSPAAAAGIVGGDVVTRLGSSAVQSLEDFTGAVARLQPGQSVAIRLIRRGAPLFLAIRVPQAEQ